MKNIQLTCKRVEAVHKSITKMHENEINTKNSRGIKFLSFLWS
jgi:hypothetical protein